MAADVKALPQAGEKHREILKGLDIGLCRLDSIQVYVEAQAVGAAQEGSSYAQHPLHSSGAHRQASNVTRVLASLRTGNRHSISWCSQASSISREICFLRLGSSVLNFALPQHIHLTAGSGISEGTRNLIGRQALTVPQPRSRTVLP